MSKNGNVVRKRFIECYWPECVEEINGILLRHNDGYYLNKLELQNFVEKISNVLKSYDEIEIDNLNKEVKKYHEEELRKLEESMCVTESPRAKQKGFVYFITDDTKLVKIGLSKNVNTRFKTMQTGNSTLKMIYYIETKDMDLTEKLFHERFKKKRIHGEWFQLTDADIEYIKKGKYGKKVVSSINGDLNE